MSTKAIPVVTVPGVDAPGASGAGASGATAAGTERASQSAEQFSKAIETLRGRSDLAAKALGGVGTAAISALGYAKLTDVFPYGGPGWALAALIVGPIAMVVALGFLVRGFYTATQSLITSSDIDETVSRNGMKPAEKTLVEQAYRDTAKLNGVNTLRAYEARGQRFERIAERAPTERAKCIGEAAARIAAEVAATQQRAATFVLRRRSTEALFGIGTIACLVLFVGGWYAPRPAPTHCRTTGAAASGWRKNAPKRAPCPRSSRPSCRASAARRRPRKSRKRRRRRCSAKRRSWRSPARWPNAARRRRRRLRHPLNASRSSAP